MKEIVAARIGTLITSNPRHIYSAVEMETVTEFIDRQRMQLMAAMDLGENWTRLANAPTLFRVDDKGGLHPPKDKP